VKQEFTNAFATKALRHKRFGFEENQGYPYVFSMCLVWFLIFFSIKIMLLTE